MSGELTQARKKDVQIEVEELKRQVDFCSKALSELTSSLAPVLRNEPAQSGLAEKAPDTTVPLAGAIREENDRLRNIVVDIASMTKRIEV